MRSRSTTYPESLRCWFAAAQMGRMPQHTLRRGDNRGFQTFLSSACNFPSARQTVATSWRGLQHLILLIRCASIPRDKNSEAHHQNLDIYLGKKIPPQGWEQTNVGFRISLPWHVRSYCVQYDSPNLRQEEPGTGNTVSHKHMQCYILRASYQCPWVELYFREINHRLCYFMLAISYRCWLDRNPWR